MFAKAALFYYCCWYVFVVLNVKSFFLSIKNNSYISFLISTLIPADNGQAPTLNGICPGDKGGWIYSCTSQSTTNTWLWFWLHQLIWNTNLSYKNVFCLCICYSITKLKQQNIIYLSDAFIQSDLLCIQATHFLISMWCDVCSLGIEPTTFCAANAMLYHWATGTHNQMTHNSNNIVLHVSRIRLYVKVIHLNNNSSVSQPLKNKHTF